MQAVSSSRCKSKNPWTSSCPRAFFFFLPRLYEKRPAWWISSTFGKSFGGILSGSRGEMNSMRRDIRSRSWAFTCNTRWWLVLIYNSVCWSVTSLYRVVCYSILSWNLYFIKNTPFCILKGSVLEQNVCLSTRSIILEYKYLTFKKKKKKKCPHSTTWPNWFLSPSSYNMNSTCILSILHA